jgi:hypothetical protein
VNREIFPEDLPSFRRRNAGWCGIIRRISSAFFTAAFLLPANDITVPATRRAHVGFICIPL